MQYSLQVIVTSYLFQIIVKQFGMRIKLLTGLCLLSFCLLCPTEASENEEQAEAGADPEADVEPMFGTLDYILLAAIGAAAIWWLFIRDTEADKIPKVCIKQKARVLGAINVHLLFSSDPADQDSCRRRGGDGLPQGSCLR